jgi:hypothetical protein
MTADSGAEAANLDEYVTLGPRHYQNHCQLQSLYHQADKLVQTSLRFSLVKYRLVL